MIKVSNNNLDLSPYNDDQINWIYCALDCALTQEIWEKISKDFDDTTRGTYDFEIKSLKPAMAMTLRGLRVDEDKVKAIRKPLQEKRLQLERMLHLFSRSVNGKDLNHNSPVQLKKLLYEDLNLPPVISYKKGKQKISTDRDALESLSESYPRARPLVELSWRCVT